jgi:hypothetical protein
LGVIPLKVWQRLVEMKAFGAPSRHLHFQSISWQLPNIAEMPGIPGILSQAVFSSKEILLGTFQPFLPVITLLYGVRITRAICS